MMVEEARKKPGLIRTQMVAEATYIELDAPTIAAIRGVVKEMVVREFQFVASFGACLAITLIAVFSGISHYLSGNYQVGQSLALPAIAGICGIAILAYAYHKP